MSKRTIKLKEMIDPSKKYSAIEACTLVKELSSAKFKESVDIAIQLGKNVRKGNQVTRGSSLLPHGNGKDIKLMAFVEGENKILAEEAGADIVGAEELIEQVKENKISFNAVIAMPDTMHIVSKLGTILGPRGLMPNPKLGTVTTNIKQTIKNIKSGQINFRIDKNCIIHSCIGNISFNAEELKHNLEVMLADVKKLKPHDMKGTYIKKISISSTMGPGFTIDMSSVSM